MAMTRCRLADDYTRVTVVASAAMTRRSRLILLLASLPFLAQAAPKPAPKPGAPEPEGRAVRVTVETIAVDRRGTWSLGTDTADLFTGGTGTLVKSATLLGRGDDPDAREMVELTARLTPVLDGSGNCSL